MKTRFVEATQGVRGGLNHGKFMVAAFDAEEWARRCELDREVIARDARLLSRCGWTDEHFVVFDLATGEGALFRAPGSARADLNSHRVWVCPMFEPFLEWAYGEARKNPAGWFDALPALVELPDAPAAMQGYRRRGDDGWPTEINATERLDAPE